MSHKTHHRKTLLDMFQISLIRAEHAETMMYEHESEEGEYSGEDAARWSKTINKHKAEANRLALMLNIAAPYPGIDIFTQGAPVNVQ
jgi:hypothetical protein